jgi:hypothetical protein
MMSDKLCALLGLDRSEYFRMNKEEKGLVDLVTSTQNIVHMVAIFCSMAVFAILGTGWIIFFIGAAAQVVSIPFLWEFAVRRWWPSVPSVDYSKVIRKAILGSEITSRQ